MRLDGLTWFNLLVLPPRFVFPVVINQIADNFDIHYHSLPLLPATSHNACEIIMCFTWAGDGFVGRASVQHSNIQFFLHWLDYPALVYTFDTIWRDSNCLSNCYTTCTSPDLFSNFWIFIPRYTHTLFVILRRETKRNHAYFPSVSLRFFCARNSNPYTHWIIIV